MARYLRPLPSTEDLKQAKQRSPRLFWIIVGTIVALVMLIPALVCGLYFGLAHARAASRGTASTIIDLGYSKFQGSEVANGVSQWLGIRYAAPPTGDFRFRAPYDPLRNTVVQVANKHGAVCLSSPSTSVDKGKSEDCLFLDVYAPTPTTGTYGTHPVYVFFQGGGFNSMSAPNMDANKLINAGAHDIVVVTFNYRVGPYGFLASKEVKQNGDLNVGLLDQRKVLQWVKKYISAFGGDPNHVTIGGASAGGGAVDLHMTAYGGRDDKLFHAAAAESQSFGAENTVAEAQYQYDALIKRVGCSTAADTLGCLRATPIETIENNNPDIPTPGGPGYSPKFMWSPVIDGTFITDYTYNLFAQGNFIKVPSIFGDSTDEGTIFTPDKLDSTKDMHVFLADNFVKLTDTQLAKIDTYYPKAQQYPNKGSYWKASANAYGEIRYTCPGIYLNSAVHKAGIVSSWNYRWDVTTAATVASGLGATHAAATASIWGSSSAPDNALTPAISAYWTSFIRSKDPNTYKLASTPRWSTWNGTVNPTIRILFPNDPKKIGMEQVTVEQRTRCAYLSSIGAAIQQ